jgi:hypothetical protein
MLTTPRTAWSMPTVRHKARQVRSVRRTTDGVRTGWQPDPFGCHELRLFSPEGKPTQHVCDGDRHSYETLSEFPRTLVWTTAADNAKAAANRSLVRRWGKRTSS